ncbi:MAG: aminoglycoside phosphotransferase family protein [Magnetococcales bacterium]|nr:aminoglycoside phosphotransferase family protein [Magnetococcales bacterium]MBF0322276.1 aminoglycoside phosphotransferase family protein [Magnetococcales bacterium]
MTSCTTCSTVEAIRLASALLGEPVELALPVAGGGNNRLFRVQGRAQKSYALKFYPRQEQDPRDRLGQEFAFLRFLHQQGVTGVPAALAMDPKNGCALYDWIDGVMIQAPGAGEMEAMLHFLERLHVWRHVPAAQQLVAASDSCFSPQAAVSQLGHRLARCREVAATEPALQTFLDEEFTPVSRQVLLLARQIPGYAQPLPLSARTLSPSDFGWHNALRRADGEVIFLDFEYAGWDDPVKLVADVLWHPGMDLPESLARQFLEGAKKIYDTSGAGGFGRRFDRLQPVFGLIWCLILLNEFLPERWQRRVLAGRTDAREEVLARQLSRARQRLERILDKS